MTNEEALKKIPFIQAKIKILGMGGMFGENPNESIEALDMAIQSLEKQIQKKPNQDYDKAKNLTYYKCPCCGRDVITFIPENRMTIKEHHCRCGQAILWSEDND